MRLDPWSRLHGDEGAAERGSVSVMSSSGVVLPAGAGAWGDTGAALVLAAATGSPGLFRLAVDKAICARIGR